MAEIAAEPQAAGAAPPRTATERRTSPVELLWDLVFVFAITQVATLLSRHLDWSGFGHAMLILALIWWAWSAFVWAANAQESDAVSLRLALLVATAFIFLTGLAVPDALTSKGLLFAISYAVVRLIHLALYADASRRGNASWSAIAGFGMTVLIGMGLLVLGAALHGTARLVLWGAAVAIDYAGPAWLTRERLRGLQQVAVAHFAERYGLFVIICLGESIVAIGQGATSGHQGVGADEVVVVMLGLLITVGLWWTYFDRFAQIAEDSLRANRDPVLAAADGYSYLHLVLVAGIITFAAGVRLLVRAPHVTPSDGVRLAVCGGVGLYLLGHVAFKLRMTGKLGYGKLVVLAALAILYRAGSGLSPWALAALITALLAALCAAETVDRRRLGFRRRAS
jgi:low temperature requirement protein LtrA